jgi:seryl-tRNA synthetase
MLEEIRHEPEAIKATLTNRLRQKSDEAELLKKQRNQLISERNSVEIQRRKFDEEIVDKGNVKLLLLQTTIGDLMASISSFKMEIESGKTSLKGLQKNYDCLEDPMVLPLCSIDC